jgi:hypothetical protein
MEMENDAFLDLVGGQKQELEAGIRDTLESLVAYEGRITSREDRFLPGVLAE